MVSNSSLIVHLLENVLSIANNYIATSTYITCILELHSLVTHSKEHVYNALQAQI